MSKLSKTQILHKLAEDNLRVESLYNFLIKKKCKCELTTEIQKVEGIDHPVVLLWIENHNGLCALTGTSDYNYINCLGFLAVDFKKCFNKWSQVPIRISLKRTDEEIYDIMMSCNTKDNYEKSLNFKQIFWDE